MAYFNFLVKLALVFGLGMCGMYIVLIIPLPAIVLDILIVVNLAQAILIFLIVLCRRKTAHFPLLPGALFISMIFGWLINISYAKLILTKSAAFDGFMIWIVSSLVNGSGEILDLVVGFVCLILIILAHLMVVNSGISRILENDSCIVQDRRRHARMIICAEQDSVEISDDAYSHIREERQQEMDFVDAMASESKSITGSVIMILIIIIITILTGITIDVLFRGEVIIDAVRTYIFFSTGYGLLSIFPVLLLSIASALVIIQKRKNLAFQE
jgi:flagellar biosynthesis protein FlhA